MLAPPTSGDRKVTRFDSLGVPGLATVVESGLAAFASAGPEVV
jgi:hypothetical protein